MFLVANWFAGKITAPSDYPTPSKVLLGHLPPISAVLGGSVVAMGTTVEGSTSAYYVSVASGRIWQAHANTI
ncbi:hypothetical protein KSP40_PGU017643 [Platanthera guangdongensis]|uniref:Uncharacterized protein n=1 Tax=Platanthera guangdongensis TaxID=2320717 RepID=A0ABR2MLE4_9ASPA